MVYGKLAELIITEYFKQTKNDNSNYTIRGISEQIAQEQAFFAKSSAFEQDKMGECVYANDQFITNYRALTLLIDADGILYVPMPNNPSGLPQGREVAYIAFTGNKDYQIIPMRNKDRFMQQGTKTPKWMVLAYVEGHVIKLDNTNPLITPSTATLDLKLVGAAPIGELVSQELNVPKDVEAMIFDKILSRMLPMRNVLPDNINDAVSK